MMFSKKLISFLLLVSCSLVSAAAPLAHNQIADVGATVHTVGRSGILPFKNYGADGPHGPGSNWSVIIGVGNFGRKVAGPFSGSVDISDASVQAAAARECCEETSGALDLRNQLHRLDINNMVFSGPLRDKTTGLPNPQNCLFVLRDDAVSVAAITTQNQKALKREIHTDKPDCWRENTHAVAIDFPTLHALLVLSRSGKILQGVPVYFETRNGNVESIDKHYMGAILAATPVLQKITGYQFFYNPNGNIYNQANIVDAFRTELAWAEGDKKRACYEYLRCHVVNQLDTVQQKLSEVSNLDLGAAENFPVAHFLNLWNNPGEKTKLVDKIRFWSLNHLFGFSETLEELDVQNIQIVRDVTFSVIK